ncbi:MAG: response regulator transcription factor [Myxococcota bacterium]
MDRSIVIVEDDPELSNLLHDYFVEQGFAVQCLEDGRVATERIIEQPPDLVILDQMLPGLNGVEVCQRVRAHSTVPILMLTAVQGDIDVVAGLEAGVDDYVIKPCNPRVLLARVRALLRRAAERPDDSDQDEEIVCVGSLEVNRSRRTVRIGAHQVAVTAAEHDLAYLLALHKGSVVTRDTLSIEVRGVPYDGIDRGIDIHVSRLRKKLHEGGLRDVEIRAIRGEGYQLVLATE